MTKRLILSLAMVAVTLSGVTAATFAYFSSGQVLGNNTFQTGNVNLGGFNYTSLSLTNLTPGVPVVVPNFAVNYLGSINADIYVGARGTSHPGDAAYLADKLYLRVYYQGTSAVAWEGWVNQLSTSWKEIAANTPGGWKAYDLQFTLDGSTDNTHQGVTNSDTEILIYAVQTGSPAPTTLPYLTTGNGPWL
jgi:predicted ribosomally synthesized peptide with SipW-like signal peptide